ncbi:hypothetical protein EGW08_003597 [Elysia chlorotica]|uniref:C-type lectin domain-containing protein n=1 Tax=Elysia chlorotica TaxID=188477 RepID=A0A433U4C3_ELYCH|nr:hypothetical protein EGW08_003597 [Elysia chlorotica]
MLLDLLGPIDGAVDTSKAMKFFRNIFHGPHTSPSTIQEDGSHSEGHMSAIQCAVSCRKATSPGCNSFLYSGMTGLCRHAQNVRSLEGDFRLGYGDLYAGCDIGRGYKIYTTGNTTACLMFVPSAKSYNDAVTTCNQNQGYLPSVKTREKLNILHSFLTNDYPYVWVGFSDAATEGVYIWEEDGSAMTSAQQTDLFQKGQPNDGGSADYTDDCGMIWIKYSGLNDGVCTDPYYVVCEMKIDSVSAVSGPLVSEPVVSEPQISEPQISEPVVIEPIASEPVVIEPIASEPLVSEPLVSEPLVSEPVVSDLVSEPLVSEP